MYLITVKPIKFNESFEIVLCAQTPKLGSSAKMNPTSESRDTFVPTVFNGTNSNPGTNYSWYDN